MRIIKTGWQGVDKVTSNENILGVAAIYRVPGEDGLVTKVFHAVAAVPAIAIYAAHPRNTDTLSQRQLGCRSFDHLAHDLVSGSQPGQERIQVSFDDM